jgi:LysM repeat protein
MRHTTLQVTIALVLLTPATAKADLWGTITNTVKNTVKQTVTTVVQTVTTVVAGAGKVVGGVVKVVTGHADEGLREMGDGAVQVVVSAGFAAVSVADPILGTLLFNGQPTPLQGIAKWIYDTVSRWKGKPTCNPAEQIGRLMTVPKNTLGDGDRVAGYISTPAKYLSSLFDGTSAWEPTGCNGVGIGKPIRRAEQSLDGLWTIDLELLYFETNGVKSPKKRYLRLEVMPGVDANRSASEHPPVPSDVIGFGGPMMWDKDTDGDHPYGHMEVHPLGALQFGAKPPDDAVNTPQPIQSSATINKTDDPLGLLNAKPDSSPTKYVVLKGDCLSKIAERFYNEQCWPVLFRANRNQIEDPDLIYPGQEIVLPQRDIASQPLGPRRPR